MSNAELLDREWMSKIPTVDAAGGRAAVPVHELTWKTVFLNSLVGRHEGLTSNVFGVTEAEAILQTAYPGLAPYNVRQALEAIRENAYYLRYEQGKYFAAKSRRSTACWLAFGSRCSSDRSRGAWTTWSSG